MRPKQPKAARCRQFTQNRYFLHAAPILLLQAVWAPFFYTAGDGIQKACAAFAAQNTDTEAQAETLLKEGQAAKVLTILKQSKNQKTLSEIAQYRLKSMALEALYRKDAAISIAKEGLGKYPKDAKLHFIMAKLIYDRKDPQPAINELTKAIELDDKFAEAYLERAKAYFVLSEHYIGKDYLPQARQDLTHATKLNPNLAAAYDYEGVWATAEGRYSDAVKLFDKALQVEPRNYSFLCHRATALNFSNQTDKALKDIALACQLKPHEKTVWKSRANMLIQQKRYAEALQVVDSCLKIDKSGRAYEILLLKARVLTLLKRHEEAIAIYDKMIALSPLDEDNYVARGKCYLAQSNFAKALDSFNEAIALNPDIGLYYELRSTVYDRTGKKKEAESDRNKAALLKSQKLK
ncbi:MAG: tetratricopeptide repeat protein [Candidatus Obscuribacterales bacterium]|nr:tetratricopeptide repeat protein [Candidatus Obscuribacterales bacterium]